MSPLETAAMGANRQSAVHEGAAALVISAWDAILHARPVMGQGTSYLAGTQVPVVIALLICPKRSGSTPVFLAWAYSSDHSARILASAAMQADKESKVKSVFTGVFMTKATSNHFIAISQN